MLHHVHVQDVMADMSAGRNFAVFALRADGTVVHMLCILLFDAMTDVP
jgi:hypothetical protein